MDFNVVTKFQRVRQRERQRHEAIGREKRRITETVSCKQFAETKEKKGKIRCVRSDFRRDSEYWAAYFFYQKCIVYCDSYYYYLLVIRPLFTRAHSSALQLSAIQKNEHNGHGDMSARLGTNTFACRLRESFVVGIQNCVAPLHCSHRQRANDYTPDIHAVRMTVFVYPKRYNFLHAMLNQHQFCSLSLFALWNQVERCTPLLRRYWDCVWVCLAMLASFR